MAVVVLSELAQHAVQVTPVGDQQPVEALPSDAADESLSDRVCLRRPDRRADHTDALGTEHRVNGARELGVVVADEELQRLSRSGSENTTFLACWVVDAPSGFSLRPASCTRRVESPINNST